MTRRSDALRQILSGDIDDRHARIQIRARLENAESSLRYAAELGIRDGEIREIADRILGIRRSLK